MAPRYIGPVMTLEVYERAVFKLCEMLRAPEGYDRDCIARGMPLEEIAMELQELAERRSRCRTA